MFQDLCQNLVTLDSSKIDAGTFLIIFDDTVSGDHFRRAFVAEKIGEFLISCRQNYVQWNAEIRTSSDFG